LVHTDARLTYENNKNKSQSYEKLAHYQEQKDTFKNELVQTCALGCTMLMNRKLNDMAAPVAANARAHDAWVELIATSVGYKGHVKEQMIDYRQHEHNAAGGLVNNTVTKRMERALSVINLQFMQGAR
jgi:hypothetical protein